MDNVMLNNAAAGIAELIEQQTIALLEDWTARVLALWGSAYLSRDELYQASQSLLEQVRKLLLRAKIDHPHWEPQASDDIVVAVTRLGESWAKRGLTAAQTALYVLVLKRMLLERYRAEHAADCDAFVAAVVVLDLLLERLSLVAVERFEVARERLIKQQSLALLELSTPVVKIWEHMILLPLVGIIDTLRARKITENLLQAIAEVEARVTIIDITGVPVLDTAVAGHLIKTITAAQMLGTHVILTGMSPEGAQTLVKLGVSLGDVTTRATLKAGVAEGLAALGLAINPGGRR